ncbi:MAG: hypothetical protein NUV46_00015 [Nanoarchaeota archaeon]|nr:hypothetical protein [Nanoarchaeota archaeon]
MNRNLKSLILLSVFLVLLLITPFVSAKDIYVSNNCVELFPCYSNLSQAVFYADSNDKIVVKSGEHFVDFIEIEKDITIQGENKEETILYPSFGTTCCTGDSQAWFLVKDKVIFEIQGLTFDGSGKKIAQAIRSFGQGKIHDNIFKNISWSDNQGAAVVAFGGDTVISSNSFSGIGRNSIWVGSYFSQDDSGAYVSIVGNNYQILNNVLNGKGECDCIDKGIEVGVGTSGTVISGNEVFNYKGRYSAERSYSVGIFAWNVIGEKLEIEIYNNSIHDCVLPIYLIKQGGGANQIKISGNNMYGNEFDGLNANQGSKIPFEGINLNDETSEFSGIPDYLFDVEIEIQDKSIKAGETLNVIMKFESFGTLTTKAHINYIILDESRKEVYSLTEDIVVETEEVMTKKFEGLNLLDGEYLLYVKVDYGNVSDSFEQSFFVGSNIKQVTPSLLLANLRGSAYLFFMGAILIGFLLVLYLRHKKIRKEELSRKK